MAYPSSSKPRQQQPRPRQGADVFRPKFPLDPFVACDVREPWYIQPDRLPLWSAHSNRDVVLVLGVTSPKEIAPLLLSKHLANALLIIASHTPLEFPSTTLPTIRVLKLLHPLEIENTGALRFVNVLEWAERVARLWRKYGGFGIAELSEDDDGFAYLPTPSVFSFRGSQSTPNTPRSSTYHLNQEDPISTRPRSSSARFLSRSRISTLPAVDSTQRPFDALLNFLPGNTSDKALLKQSILVTTISRPFLAAADPYPRKESSRSGGRPSIFSSKSSNSLYLSSTLPYSSRESLEAVPNRAHIVHLLPNPTRSFNSFARSKLVQGLESFLLSYAYPTSSSLSKPSFVEDDPLERAKPYILSAATFSEIITSDIAADTTPISYDVVECTIAELVLCGALDQPDIPKASNWNGGKGKLKSALLDQRKPPRAWISGPADFVFVSDEVASPTSTYTSPGLTSAAKPGVLVTPPQAPLAAAKSPSTPTRVVPVTRQTQQHLDRPDSFGTSVSSHTASSPLVTAPNSTPPPFSPISRPLPVSVSHSYPVVGSPLARSANSKQTNMGFGSYAGYGGLPTPPDSDESGSELTTSLSASGSTHGSLTSSPNPRQDPQRMRSESFPSYWLSLRMHSKSHLGTNVGGIPNPHGEVEAVKRSRSKWKFWKSSSSSAVAATAK